MAYNERKMLEDVNGDLIPQYYDPVEDVFKPLTNDPRDVRLTGSKVVEQIMENETVPTDSYRLVTGINLNDFLSISIAYYNPDNAFPGRIRYRERVGSSWVSTQKDALEISSQTGISGIINITGTGLGVFVYNDSEEDALVRELYLIKIKGGN